MKYELLCRRRPFSIRDLIVLIDDLEFVKWPTCLSI